jgi:hypothetical protein
VATWLAPKFLSIQVLPVLEITSTTVVAPDAQKTTVVLLKLQFGVVFKVNVLLPAAVGVPEAVSTMFCAPVPAKVPEPANVTPLAVVEILYVPTVVTVAVMVCVTPDTAIPATIVPAEAVEQLYPETTAVPLVEG